MPSTLPIFLPVVVNDWHFGAALKKLIESEKFKKTKQTLPSLEKHNMP